MAFYTFGQQDFTQKEVVRTAIDSYLGISSKEGITFEQRAESINQVLKDLGQNYQENKYKIFAIIEGTLNEVLPKKIADFFRFANVKEFKEGDTPAFTIKNGKIKAYWVAKGGTVRRYRKDKSRITVETEAVMAKVYEEETRIKAGLVDFNELMNDCEVAVLDAIKEKVHQTFIAVISKLPNANKFSGAGVIADELKKLIAVVKSYGNPVIHGTFAGLSQLPDQTGSVISLERTRELGYDDMWNGTPTKEWENFVKEGTDNAEFQLSNRYIFIIPEGKDQIMQIGFEGGTTTREIQGADWTLEWALLRQLGIAILQYNYFAVYENTNLI